MKTPKINLKYMAFYHERINGEFMCVVSVNSEKHYFSMFETAIKFHRSEYRSFEKEGFDGVASVITIPLNKTEMKRATGK